MCHNHSHLAGYVPETITTDQFEVHTVVLDRPLAVELPTGEKLILPSSTTLYALSLKPVTPCSPELREMVAHSIALSVVGVIAYAFGLETRVSSRIGSSE